jgi:hypothetical protein
MDFEKDKFIQLHNIVKDNKYFKSLVDEAQFLSKYNEEFKVKYHCQYKHCKPSTFKKYKPNGKWLLPEFYQSSKLREIVENVVKKKLYTLPLEDSDKFEINCKLNYYTYLENNKSKVSTLDYHYDRTDQVEGNVYVVVLTLVNDLGSDTMNLTNYKYQSKIPESIHCEANSITIHEAKYIFHKVENVVVNPKDYPKNTKLERIVFVMKFTDNPHPQNFITSTYNKLLITSNYIISYCNLYFLNLILFIIVLIVLIILIKYLNLLNCNI